MGAGIMPKLTRARLPEDAAEEHRLRKLARSQHAPGNRIQRVRMIVRNWDGLRMPTSAEELSCNPQTVRERVLRLNVAGLEGSGHRLGPGRKLRQTKAEWGRVIALVATAPPGQLVPERMSWSHAMSKSRPIGRSARW